MKIGFILPLGEDTDLGRAPAWQEIRSLAQQAEAGGLDSVWVYDHLLYRFPDHGTVGVQECWSVLSALAASTDRVDLGTLVMPTSWRNPALLAKMAVTVDEISGGRLILGVGTGFHQPEFDAFGYPFDHRVDRFEEALQVIGPLLREGKVDFTGTYVSAPNCELRPVPSRKIPLLIAGRGPRMLRLTAAHADLWNMAWFGDVSALALSRADLEAACAGVGRDPGTLGVTVGVHVALPEALDDAPNPDRVLTGSPEEIAAGLRGYRDAGVEHVICGALAATTYNYTTKVIALVAEVLAL
ncbi:MAG TPA: LLM class flavin-dependent oxidoreductase, partial [Thermomicrobiales bacterium]|nr:LLM class flavin-dependent oxidoreductase [Thermomicrobiales bacterium]